jgi:hypothetical protein
VFEDLQACSDSEITDALGQLVGGMAAIHRVVLELVRHCQERRVWKDDGMPSMADWLEQSMAARGADALFTLASTRLAEDAPDGSPLNTGPPGLRPDVRGELAAAIRAPLPLAS